MNYKQYNDYELIYMIRENDEESKGIMYKKYYPIIRTLAAEFYGRYSNYGYDLEDFVQEGCIFFFHALSTYDEQKDNLFYSYCLIIVKRGLLSFCRNISRTGKELPNQCYLSLDDCNFIEDKKNNMDFICKDQDFQNFVKKLIYRDLDNIGALLDIPSTSAEFKIRKMRGELRKMIHQYHVK